MTLDRFLFLLILPLVLIGWVAEHLGKDPLALTVLGGLSLVMWATGSLRVRQGIRWTSTWLLPLLTFVVAYVSIHGSGTAPSWWNIAEQSPARLRFIHIVWVGLWCAQYIASYLAPVTTSSEPVLPSRMSLVEGARLLLMIGALAAFGDGWQAVAKGETVGAPYAFALVWLGAACMIGHNLLLPVSRKNGFWVDLLRKSAVEPVIAATSLSIAMHINFSTQTHLLVVSLEAISMVAVITWIFWAVRYEDFAERSVSTHV